MRSCPLQTVTGTIDAARSSCTEGGMMRNRFWGDFSIDCFTIDITTCV
jgi:hypothetical protein